MERERNSSLLYENFYDKVLTKKEKAETHDQARRVIAFEQPRRHEIPRNVDDRHGQQCRQGASLTSQFRTPQDFTTRVLVMDKFQQTLKLLHTIASGKYIVSSLWLDECDLQGKVTDYSQYLFDGTHNPGLLNDHYEWSFHPDLSTVYSIHPTKSGYKVFAGCQFFIDLNCKHPINVELVELIYFCVWVTCHQQDIKNSPNLIVIVSV